MAFFTPKIVFIATLPLFTLNDNLLSTFFRKFAPVKLFKQIHVRRFIPAIITAGILFFTPRFACAKDFTIVIDPGHGGHDVGATGIITTEKAINLGVALKLGKLIDKNMNDAKVVYTRSTDIFIPLQKRADIANKAKGDIFVSIHTNSVDKKSKNRKSVEGASVYTLGFRGAKDNLEVAMRENSVIKLEKDYSTTYQGFDPSSAESYIIFEMSQNKHMDNSVKAANAVQRNLVNIAGRKDRSVRQSNFWVLHASAMPSMLIELDFICNPQVERYLDSESGQQELAEAIFAGLCEYHGVTPPARKARKKATTEVTTDQQQPSKEIPSDNSSDTPCYKIQFLTSTRKIKDGSASLKGLSNVDFYRDGSSLKYTYGSYSSENEAAKDLKKIKKSFPDAFIIKFVNGKRVK